MSISAIAALAAAGSERAPTRPIYKQEEVRRIWGPDGATGAK